MSNWLNLNRGIRLDLQQLETFQKVVVTGSFTRAAAALGYSQSNVSHQIKTLEARLGLSLFNRTRFSKRPVLTEAGRHVLLYSDRILELAQRLLSKEGMESGS